MGHGVSTCATCDGYFFREQADRGGGGRRLRDGGGDLPDEVRLARHDHPPARSRSARRRSCRTRRGPTRRSRVEMDTVVDDVRDVDQGVVTGIVLRNVRTNEVEGELEVDGLSSSRSAIRRTRRSPTGQLESGPERLHHPACSGSPPPAFQECLRAATFRITSTARRSPPAGSGCMAAIDAERYLESLPAEDVQAVGAATSAM